VDLRVDVFVDGRADLILNYGVPYTRRIIGGEVSEHARSTLDAQRLVPIRVEQRGRVHIVGVRFRLGGLGPFCRGDLRLHTGKTPPPEAVFGGEVKSLEAAVAGLEPDAAVPLLDRFFSETLRLDAGRAGFERALECLESSGGLAEVQTVAARAGASVRQVDRWFARHIGIPPKMVGRILRFQGALKMLMRDPGCTLAEVAAAAQYFDQAHFVRDFRQMSGGVPRGYRGYYPPAGPKDFAPNVVVFVQEEAGAPQ
jgi:AraC-like DNA-binding protein